MTFSAAKLAICAGGDGDRVGGCDSKEERGLLLASQVEFYSKSITNKN
jgi:hypothetical protein